MSGWMRATTRPTNFYTLGMIYANSNTVQTLSHTFQHFSAAINELMDRHLLYGEVKMTHISDKINCYILAVMLSVVLVFGLGFSTNAQAAVEICNGVDDDADGLKDEGFADLDNDGQANCVDTDDDGDNIVDSRDPDDDNDGAPDTTDRDDDNDGTSDVINADDDNDGVPDALDTDDNNDGILDTSDTDDDDDGAPDVLDVDDNNDGIPEQEICNGVDDDHDGSTDEGFADLDGDGQKNCADADDDNDALPDSTDADNDNDGIADAIDLDDDNDGVPEVEICNGVDDDSDRLVDEGFDLDRDGIPSCRDTDDDNDGDLDVGDTDDNNNGVAEIEICNGIDDDQDGSVDEDGADLDNDGRNNCTDVDDDNDGISDSEDADDDNDGTPDSIDLDDDNDGVGDIQDLDADNDGIDNVADTDDDNDGYSDSTEAAAGTGINNSTSEPIYVNRANLAPVDSLGNPALSSIQGLTYVGDRVVALAMDLSAQPVLAMIDTATGVVEASYPLTGSYSAITTDGTVFYVLDSSTVPGRIKVLDAVGSLLNELVTPTLVSPVGLGYDGRLLVTDNAGEPLLRFLDVATGNELATFNIAASVDVELLDGALLSVYPNGGVYLVHTSPCNGYLAGPYDVGICAFVPDQLLFTVTNSGGIATDGVNVFAAGSPPAAPASAAFATTSATASGVVISRTVPLNPASSDLVMTAVTPSTASVNAGKPLLVTNTVANQGLSRSIGFPIAFRLSTNAIYGDADDLLIPFVRSVMPLGAGMVSTATSSLMIAKTVPAGNYYICAKADPGNAVNEMNENNNSRCSTAVTVVSLPDLMAASVSGVTVGKNVSVRDVVSNIGTVAAGAFSINYYLSSNNLYDSMDSLLCSRAVGGLGVGLGSSGITSCPLPLGTSAGGYYVVAVVDAGSAVAEFSEINNIKVATVVTRVGIDLMPTSVTWTRAGMTLTIKDTAKNTGSLDAGAFTVGFYMQRIPPLGAVAPAPVLVCSRNVPSLASGFLNSGVTVCDLSALSVGSYKVSVADDVGNAVMELNEMNNVRFGLSMTITQ